MVNILQELFEIIEIRRKTASPQKSYVAKLFARGKQKIAQKTGEEAVETVVAYLSEGKKETINESADLLFHLCILWADKGIEPEDVLKEIKSRMGKSGLDEKAARKADR